MTKLGIIAGNGVFPLEVAAAARRRGYAGALVLLVFVGVPIGLLAYATVGRWSKPLPRK